MIYTAEQARADAVGPEIKPGERLVSALTDKILKEVSWSPYQETLLHILVDELMLDANHSFVELNMTGRGFAPTILDFTVKEYVADPLETSPAAQDFKEEFGEKVEVVIRVKSQ